MNRPVALWFSDFYHAETAEAIKGEHLYRFLADHFHITLNQNDPDFLIYSDAGASFSIFLLYAHLLHRRKCSPKFF